jgi:hypothetical protein
MRNIPQGQWIGGLIENSVWLGVGIYLTWFYSKRLDKQVVTGKLTPEEAANRKKTLGKYIGPLVMVLGILKIFSSFL